MRIVWVGALLVAGSVWAQCTTDTECPRGATCTNGACVTPSAPPMPEPAPAAAAPEGRGASLGAASAKQQRHWAGGAAAIGFVATGPVVASGIMSMFFLILGSNSSSLASGFTFTLLTMALVGALGPVVELGAASARFEATNEGSPAGRVMGWVFYGLSMAAGVATLVSLFTNNGGIAFFTAFGMLITGGIALICFGVDAVVSGSHANAINRQRAGTASTVRLMPGLALAPGPRGELSPVVGLAGVF